MENDMQMRRRTSLIGRVQLSMRKSFISFDLNYQLAAGWFYPAGRVGVMGQTLMLQ